MNTNNENELSRMGIVERAKNKWNSKSPIERKRYEHKYKHILAKIGVICNSWEDEFSKLNPYQKNLLIKGELIRTYDSLSNKEKTKIKDTFGLSMFSSKWFRLCPRDKGKLLSSIIK